MTSISDTNLLRECCEMAMRYPEAWTSFRSLPGFLWAIDNIPESMHQALIDAVPHTDLTPELFASDLGTPHKIELPDGRRISPGMLRYSAISRELGRRFQMHGAMIVEIGSGYGGQCRVIHNHYSKGSYVLVDLPHMLQVAMRYLQYFGIPAATVRDGVSFAPLDGVAASSNAICVSNYAFSECSREVQRHYFNGIVRFCGRGFFIYNHFDGRIGAEEFAELLRGAARVNVKIEPGPFGDDEKIKLVTWGAN